MNNKNNLLAIILVVAVILIMPKYYELVSPPPIQESSETTELENPITEEPPEVDIKDHSVSIDQKNSTLQSAVIFSVETDFYFAKVSSAGGGTFLEYDLKNYKGGFDEYGIHDNANPVSLINPDSGCLPCFNIYDNIEKSLHSFDQPFISDVENESHFLISGSDSKTFEFIWTNDDISLTKTLTFYGDKYFTEHDFFVDKLSDRFTFKDSFEISWDGGLRPTQLLVADENRSSGATISQAGNLENLVVSKAKNHAREKFIGNSDWVAIKNKYFLTAILPETSGNYATNSSVNNNFASRDVNPVYGVSIGFNSNVYDLKTRIYLGPQDVKYIRDTDSDLENAMNWGWSFIRPISKFILTTLTFIHNPFGDFTINYGIVLILFAFLVRIITGPLMKKSSQSTQKMQMIQPEVKKLQAKYKKDPAKLQQETMKLWKKHGVNPAGGCLPMIVQMPLLFALFVVFRNTIEFRGTEFILWINDLSLPDTIFHLPFNIPIYGSQVAVLPILMGVTMFFQQRISMASMDKNQKPMMYLMTGFFFLIFNSFPSGLNLYYAVSNVLNIVQQRNIKKSLQAYSTK